MVSVNSKLTVEDISTEIIIKYVAKYRVAQS